MKKKLFKWMALALVCAMLLPILAGCAENTPSTNPSADPAENSTTAPAQGATVPDTSDVVEIEYKGKTGEGNDQFMGDPQDVYWFNASVQHPDDYTKIVGFNLTATMTKIDYYGGGKENQTMACGIILATKGAHDPSEYVFSYEDGQFPKYDLSNKDIVAMGVGEASFITTMAFGNGIACNSTTQQGDTFTVSYEGDAALFAKDDPIMTVVSYLATFEYVSIEWIMGDPVDTEEKEWDRVETEQFLDVPTVSDDKQNGYNYVDITIPATGKDSYPVVLWIHGGGYITGDRKNCILSNTKDYLLAQGYAFVSVEYTLTEADTSGVTTVYGKGGMPQMLYDIKAAIRFLRANEATYKLDTSFIAAMGESAGAGLALLLGTTNGSAEHEDLTMGNAEYSSDIQAMVSFCGPTNFTGKYIFNMSAYIGEEMNNYSANKEEIDRLAALWSPVEQLDDTAVPMFLSYSQEDTTVPISHGEDLADMAGFFMDEEDVKVVAYEKGGHVERAVFDSYAAYVTLAAWLNAQLAK